MTKADLIIIGAGPGGYETAVYAAKSGLRTVIIEAASLGGTCLNTGCIPTKCLCQNADFLRNLHQAEQMGVTLQQPFSFNLAQAIERKNNVVATLIGGIEQLMRHPLITLVKGHARFVSANQIQVADATEEQDFTAPNIIIATGSVTKFLPIEGKDSPLVVTSTELLQTTTLPRRLTIIGGGVIGMEFASIFNAFGSEVTVLEYCKEILPNFDADIAKRLKQSLKSQGIRIENNAAVNIIEDHTDYCSVGYQAKGEQHSVDADLVLMAVGRAANLSSLNLNDVGIEYNNRGITTDEQLRTNLPGVYAIGDINGRCQLAHAASFQGRKVINSILGQTDSIDLNVIPAAVFTHPEAATVGLTTEACKLQGITVKAHKGFFRANGKALAMGEPEGMVKILTDEDNHIIGCHLFGAHAADLVQEVAALIARHATLHDLKDTVHAHPTLSEVILAAAEE